MKLSNSQGAKYKLKPIESLWEAFEVRKIRNECRHFMTNNTANINVLEQLIWYEQKYKSENQKETLYCFLFNTNGKNVGFGLIRQKEEKYWITGGLKKSQRGKGLGRKLFEELIKFVPSKFVWLEVLDSNIVANKLYRDLGFTKVDNIQLNGGKVNVMKLTK